MTTQTPERKPTPEHPQLAVTLEALARPTLDGEPILQGTSGGIVIRMGRSQWRWLGEEKARRHARAYRAARKARQVAA